MKATVTIGDPAPESQTLADLDDGVLATVTWPQGCSGLRWKGTGHTMRLSGETEGHPIKTNLAPHEYKVKKVHGPLRLKFETDADRLD